MIPIRQGRRPLSCHSKNDVGRVLLEGEACPGQPVSIQRNGRAGQALPTPRDPITPLNTGSCFARLQRPKLGCEGPPEIESRFEHIRSRPYVNILAAGRVD